MTAISLEESLDRLESSDIRQLNAVLSVDRKQAGRAKANSNSGSTGLLDGRPVAVKDNICTADLPTTCASRILEGYQSPYDATVVRRLRDEGAVVVCKANLDEFAMGSSTEHSAFGRTLHPLDHDRVPGGSSGGSAALVAAGAVDLALGSETGGSVRQPAAFCGVVGVKPTYGRVSRYGLVAFGSSLDQVGALGRTVEDASLLMQVISGADPLDATCMDSDPMEKPEKLDSLEGVRIGLPAEYFNDSVDSNIRGASNRAIEAMKEVGATFQQVSLPSSHLAIPTYYVIAPAEASSNLARYDGVRYGNRSTEAGDLAAMYLESRGRGFGEEVKRRIMVGTYVLSSGYYDAYYAKAQITRGLIARDFDEAFEKVDLLFTPTTPTTAFRAGEKLDDPVSMYLADIFTATANLAGVPAMSQPIGRHQGLPIGGQLIAPRFAESRMLAVGAVLESLIDPESEVA